MLSISAKDNLAVQKFLQGIIGDPRPMDDQPHESKGGKLWCEDWEIIEICKYIINGPVAYEGDPPPNRLKNNSLWSKGDVEKKAEALIKRHKGVSGIIKELSDKRGGKK